MSNWLDHVENALAELIREKYPEGALGLIPTHAGKTLPDLRLYRADRSDLGKP